MSSNNRNREVYSEIQIAQHYDDILFDLNGFKGTMQWMID